MMRRSEQRDQLATQHFDLAVVGGGISGVAVALEAARRGQRVALVERDDFGQHCSFNSLRILHGGLRYLQSLDLPRFFESVRERRWFMQNFPECCQPLECLMPLYGHGLKRPAILRAAVALNDTLSWRRNAELPEAQHIPRGKVLSASATRAQCQHVPPQGLRGAVRWHDGQMTNPSRLLIEMLHWATHAGATCLNYAQATEVQLQDGRVVGLKVTDSHTHDSLTIKTDRIINCAGQWAARALHQADAPDPPSELEQPALAFNLLLDLPAISHAAVALSPGRGQGRMYFLTPWHNRLMVGTFHRPWTQGSTASPQPTAADIALFLEELNTSTPGLNATTDHVLRVWSGLIPARHPGPEGDGETAHRATVIDHAPLGAKGLWTLQAVKYTTAMAEARRVLRRACEGRLPTLLENKQRPTPHEGPWDTAPTDTVQLTDAVQRLHAEEAVLHLDDLLLRRTDWGVVPADARALAPAVLTALGW
ncbi:MAG: FAD-dependent oxidoreductase, partial [Algisphaera sp.]